MKNFRLALCIMFFAAFTANSCRKDNLSGPLGISPHDFLSSDKYENLVIEIAYVDGYKPSDNAIANIQKFLVDHINKPSGISVFYKSCTSSGKSSLSTDDIRNIEKDEREHYSRGKTIYAFVYFSDVPYQTANVLGVAYGSTSIAIFQSSVNNNSGGVGQPSRDVLESTVGEHEFGHLLGLVDNGTKMVNDHRDYANGNHCNDTHCLMYYSTETTDVLGNLTGGNIPGLDNNCINDLLANGGR